MKEAIHTTVDADKPLPEDAEILAAHPVHSGRHDLYVEAMRLVGARHSKAALVDLVNWLLHRAEAKPKPLERQDRGAFEVKCTCVATKLGSTMHDNGCPLA
jgi:hypothetical protein